MSTNNSWFEQFKKTIHHRGKFEILKILGFAILSTVLAISTFAGYYLYQNIFSTYANLNAIASFNLIARIEVIDRQSFEDTKKIKDLKATTVTIPENLRNVFTYKEIVTTSPQTK